MDQNGFAALMRNLAEAWSTGDAHRAADCFTEDVVYVEPPDRQRYTGRQAVFELSGGSNPAPMSMTWHHLAFDPEQQVGFGEYTFRGRRQYHGIVAIQIRDGRVHRWREYQYHDEAGWEQFVGDSRFES